MSINASFQHLDTGQRNEIFHAVHNAGNRFADTGTWSSLRRQEERQKMARKLAIRYGVKIATIELVYTYVLGRRARSAR